MALFLICKVKPHYAKSFSLASVTAVGKVLCFASLLYNVLCPSARKRTSVDVGVRGKVVHDLGGHLIDRLGLLNVGTFSQSPSGEHELFQT